MIPSNRPMLQEGLASGGAMRTTTRMLLDLLRTVLIAVPLAIFIRTSVVEAYRIPSGSMEDTILAGDRLLASKLVYGSEVPLLGLRMPAVRDPVPGDVVIFRSPIEEGTNLIKRCIAVEGQTVAIRDKQVVVDGVPVEPPETGKVGPLRIGPEMDDYGPTVVPPGHLFVLGDNRDNSTDSRVWGFVRRDEVLGQALWIYWSHDPDDEKGFWGRIRWDRIGDRIR
ncbi:MAG: signal peptidase I [Candidatus Eisenbacteria bacterium]|nr:signal peptidase I [Candidatus Latescibacterota bacterium]MBD3302266.1 signal peptidase I [Candidatus Eisenbacteria bacterium]